MDKLTKQIIALYALGIIACVVGLVLIFSNTIAATSAICLVAAVIAVEIGVRRAKKLRNQQQSN